MLLYVPRRRPNRSNTHRSDHPIKRFPRLPTGDEVAALEKLAWSAPEFDVEVNSADRAIDFIFRIAVPKLPKRYRTLSSVLFPSITEHRKSVSQSWEEAFQSGFSKAKYNNKNFAKFIASPLHKLFIAGIQEWLHDESWDVEDADGKPIGPTRLAAFENKSRIGKNQPDPKLALWTARRASRFRSAITVLRADLSKRVDGMKPGELRQEILKLLPYRTFIAGLRKIGPEPNPSPKAFFTATWVTTKSMVEAMLTAELEEVKGCDLSRISLKTYLKNGEELLGVLSSLPQPLSS
jgi:hypothetical protein